MEKFCPLCAKNGIKRRVKVFQVNLEEAMFSCESEQCVWPIGYEELKFFPRPALSCNWDEELSFAKEEDMPALMELSLYTPPVTPGGELSKELTEIASTEYSPNPPAEDKVGTLPQCEYVASNESPELGSITSTEEDRGITNEQIEDVNIFRLLPKITSIEKTNINLTIFSNVAHSEHCDDRQIQEQEHSLMDASIMDFSKNFDVSDNECTQLDLNTRCKTGGESGKLQSDTTASGVEANFDAETLSEPMKTLIDINITNSAGATNEVNKCNSDLDALLEDILNNESQPVDMCQPDDPDDWLKSLLMN
ncbi:uncharacterized protein LOC112467818 [Temnothorax curvispinosus]|uniref:Uncharacterized protein LOC112467818 n=1 Tax=Temnothorax curvispinosus TaxID=300111 RepID=A0A6J1RBQ4_9HYME|nr:uncharacterized protein LOC112467818 [Temnothorax curvispinosus]XP_024892423.1 uncharacterized protein LOC112467818 [Temnothorax curvispinosus]XP_024892424.1 uncharacterized protein LOC112467818 [Temnothorax curvispinosus]